MVVARQEGHAGDCEGMRRWHRDGPTHCTRGDRGGSPFRRRKDRRIIPSGYSYRAPYLNVRLCLLGESDDGIGQTTSHRLKPYRSGSRRHRRSALAFYGRLFEFKLRGKNDKMAFIDLGDRFIALQKGRKQPADDGRHFGLVVDDKEAVRRSLESAGVSQIERAIP